MRLNPLTRRHRRLFVWLAFAAVPFLVAGIITWRMTSSPVQVPTKPCPPSVVCFFVTTPPQPPHRLHPLRAELLWGAGAALTLVAIALAAPRRKGRSPTTQPAP